MKQTKKKKNSRNRLNGKIMSIWKNQELKKKGNHRKKIKEIWNKGRK
jgi:hypothetical protein